MAPVDIVGWSESFDQLLQCKTGVLVFGEFLRSEYSEENLLFYLDCEAFKDLPPESDRTAEAKRIYREFVAVGAPRQINIDCVTRAQVGENLSDPGPDCFERAQRNVHSLMQNDSYPRFLKSQLYQALRDTATGT